MDPDVLLDVLRKHPNRSIPLDELMRAAGLDPRQEKTVKRALKGLVRDGVVDRERGRRYRMSQVGAELEGRVLVDRKGRAHLLPKGEDRSPIPLLFEEHERPMHQDLVAAKVVHFGREKRRFAKLTRIIERPKVRHVGVLQESMGAWFVELDKGPEVLIPPGQRGDARRGDLVEIEFESQDDGRNAPMGGVKSVLGQPGERDTEMAKLLIEHDLDRPFPDAVVKEAEAFGDAPRPEDIEGRRDVRDLPLVTIDGETAKDFDDAVCVVKEGRDHRLYVAIADVSHYVRLGASLDEEAFRRGTSTYLTDRAIPMLPEALSNGLCSLNPKVDRLCVLADMLVDARGRVRSATFHRAVMRSHARLTYQRVAEALDGRPDAECSAVMPTLLGLATVSRKLLERRLRRGSVDLDLPEPQVVFDERGLPVDAVRRPRNDAHRIIEDLMIAANEAVARHFLEQERATIFRVHEKPDPERLAQFASLCESMGVSARLSDDASPAEVSQLLSALSESENGRWLHGLLLRSLAQARYAAENLGHFGLASTAYLHFPSPIRRYPDLIVHRMLKQLIDDEKTWYTQERLEEVAGTCSDNERKAVQAERASLELDRALIARRLIGERLPARVTGVQTFGLFATVLEPFVEGLIPVQTLPSEYYEPDAYGSRLVGTTSGRSFALGDSVEVQIANVNVARRQVELHFVESATTPPVTRAPGKAPKSKPKPRAQSESAPPSKRSTRRDRNQKPKPNRRRH